MFTSGPFSPIIHHSCQICYYYTLVQIQRPHLDARIAEDLQRGPDVGLELVLHPGQTQQLHLHLQTLDHRGNLQRAVVDAELGLNVPRLRRGGRWSRYQESGVQHNRYCSLSKRVYRLNNNPANAAFAPQPKCTFSSQLWKFSSVRLNGADIIKRLTPIFRAPGQIESEIKQKQSEGDSRRKTNRACDSVGESPLPTRSAGSIIRCSYAPEAHNCRGDGPALLKQWLGPCVCVWVGGWGGRTAGGSEVTRIAKKHTDI